MEDVRMEMKIEASIPVQARVDLRVLAKMVLYWEKEGKYIRSMSQLVNWSMDLCSQVMVLNGKVPEEVDTLLKANNILSVRGLYQPGIMKRGARKLVRGRQLENLRMEGVKLDIGEQAVFRQAHNNNSILPAPEMVKSKNSDVLDEIYKKLDKERIDKLRKAEKKRIDAMEWDENGLAVIQRTGQGNYTEKDRIKDEKEGIKRKKAKDQNAKTLCEEIVKKTEAELLEADRRREEKEKKEKDAWDSVDVSKLKTNDGC